MSSDSHKTTTNHYRDKTKILLQDMPDYVKSFIREIHNNTSERTQYEYTLDVRNILTYFAVGKELTEITLQDLENLSKEQFEEYFEYLEHYEENGKDIYNGRASIKRKLSAIRNFMDYLFQEGKIQNTDIRKIPVPKVPESNIVHLEPDETKKLIELIKHGVGLTKKQQDYHKHQSVRDLAIAFLILASGIRVSECAELDVTDVNLEKSYAHIIRKGGDESIVYFSDEATSYLSDYMEYRKTIKGIDDEPALFISSQKRRMSVRSIENMVTKYAKMVIPNKNITPHKLRATYATQLYEATGDIYLVAENLGHKDIQTTKEHYANISDAHKEQHRNILRYEDDENS